MYMFFAVRGEVQSVRTSMGGVSNMYAMQPANGNEVGNLEGQTPNCSDVRILWTVPYHSEDAKTT